MKKFYSFICTSCLSLILLISCAESIHAQTPDAGISAITQPSDPICTGNNAVVVVIHNYGTDTIFSVNVNWLVNGVPQVQAPFTDTILSGEDDTVSIGSIGFALGTTYAISAYTTDPNGIADVDNTNDTNQVNGLTPRMSGIYTVGGTSPDFPRLTDAITALHAYGICGPVTINIRPMVDSLRISINEIDGSSATNTILIQAENGDSSSVVLYYPSENFGTNNFLIRFNGADNITLCRLTLQRTGTANLMHVLDYTAGATNNTLIYCHVIGGNALTTSTQAALVFSSQMFASNDSMNVFTNNLIEGGSYGIYLNGLNAISSESNNTITNNYLQNQSVRGIHLNFQRNLLVQGNTISSNRTTALYFGMLVQFTQGGQTITKNKIQTNNGSGMRISNCASTVSSPGLVTNNFIAGTDTSGLLIINNDNQNILNNTIVMKGTAASFSSLRIGGNSGSGNIISNNLLVNSGGGYCYVSPIFSIAGVLASDYNNLYTTGTIVGNYNGTDAALLADWVTATSQENNSVSIDPQFVSATDLHSTSVAMDNLAQPLGYVPDDIDGETRNATTPDIGADEYTGGLHDVSITALVSPGDSICGNVNTTIAVVVTNTGVAAVGGIDVITNLLSPVPATFSQTITGTLQAGMSDTLVYITGLNTVAGGTFQFQIYSNYAADEDHNNDTLYATVTIHPLPAEPVALSDSICGDGFVTLSAFSADSIFWYDASTGGNLVATGNSFTTPLLNSTTVYYVSSKNICESNRIPVSAIVHPLPIVNLGNDTIVNDSLLLDAGPGFSTYTWSTSDTTQTITVNSSAIYNVTVTDNNGCMNSDTIDVTILVGIPPVEHPEISVYPNPTRDQVTVNLLNTHSSNAAIKLFDCKGSIVRNESLDLQGSNLIHHLDVSQLKRGVYNLQLLFDESVTHFNLILY